MPVRVRARPGPERPPSPLPTRSDYELPDITDEDGFRPVIKKLALYLGDVIELPSTFEQLRTTSAGAPLRVLVDHLSANCRNPAIVNALLALKWHYAIQQTDLKGLHEARAHSCEIVAWRYLTRLSEREAVDYCLFEIPDTDDESCASRPTTSHERDEEADEMAPLLSQHHSHTSRNGPSRPVGSSSKRVQLLSSLSRLTNYSDDTSDDSTDPIRAFVGLNALEIAAVADAKRFLSQHIVQKIVTGIWNGDIVYWDSLSVHATKAPRFYNPRTMDPYSRLRVPRYLKTWEVLFFASFLFLYYLVLINRDNTHLTVSEILLFIWIAAFCYDELSEWLDAGSIFYATDIWNIFDMAIIGISVAFAVLRIIGVTTHNRDLSERAFDVLSLEALFMVPRICSILSLSPYWGTLIPCLKEMGKDFLKFMVLVVIIYIGFLTTFSLVGRETFALGRMTWILTKIFFGSTSTGFDIMADIDPFFGPPLMILFITLSSILLMGSLTGMLSNSFSRVITHAREEYLYVYSVYVLEASTSNRLTHFYPPFNLIALIVFRPWRLIFSHDDRFRAGRIWLLKLTHFPIVGAIKLYEYLRYKVTEGDFADFKGPKMTISPATLKDRPPNPHRQTGATMLDHQSPQKSASRRPASVREDDGMDAPSAMETQIAELSKKIENLTALVVAMHQTQGASATTT